MKRLVMTSGIFALFLLVGTTWMSTALLPASVRLPTWAIVGFAVVFAIIFIVELVARVGLILAGESAKRHHLLNGLALALALAAFAVAYAELGVLDITGDEDRIIHELPASLYFSVITFTTLGYGDLQPIGAGRALAAIESLCGYLVLGLLASSGATLLRQGRRGS